MSLERLLYDYLVGTGIIAFLVMTLFSLKSSVSTMIGYYFPIGYAVLIVCFAVLVPIGAGVINSLAKYFVYKENRSRISMNFWYYGLLLMLIYLSIETLFTRMSPWASPLFAFTAGSLLIGTISRYV